MGNKNAINVTEIFDRIYQSEINMTFASDWDGGYYTVLNGEKIYLKGNGAEECIIEMANIIALRNADSAFAEWWKK